MAETGALNPSEHFSFDEMTVTSTGLPNVPGAACQANLVRLCDDLMEPIRSLLNQPLHVNSGYRSPAVNHAVGGASNSAHLEGRACDFKPTNGMAIRDAFDVIRRSTLPIDKILLECHGANTWWIHVQIARVGSEPRGKAYTAEVTAHGTVYTEVTDGATGGSAS
jgi:hypothetical protein